MKTNIEIFMLRKPIRTATTMVVMTMGGEVEPAMRITNTKGQDLWLCKRLTMTFEVKAEQVDEIIIDFVPQNINKSV